MADQKISETLKYIYHSLFERYGKQHWWPAKTSFEVMVGAILTQSCAWRNVEKAITNLKEASALSAESLRSISATELAKLIRPCGFYRAKAIKLQNLVLWLKKYRDDLSRLPSADTVYLRDELLSIYGIGEETADSILLYAIGKPVFVIDAYTRRIIDRVGLLPENDRYAGYQALFMDNLPQSAELYNEYHALLVRLGKDACRKKPLCQRCPLTGICRHRKDRSG